MKNTAMQSRLADEIRDFIDQRKTLQLATLGEDGVPYASYAPFARAGEQLLVLLSDAAVHGLNLLRHPAASVLIVEDEQDAEDIFARVRINYRVEAQPIDVESAAGGDAIEHMVSQLGDRPRNLAAHADFRLFALRPQQGRYIKGFGRAYSLAGGSLGSDNIEHLRVGHRRRETENA